MQNKITPLDEEEKPPKNLGGAQRMLLYLCYIIASVLCYLGITALSRIDFNFWIEDFFVLIGAWFFLSIFASILLYPLSKLKAAGLGVLVMLASLFVLNLIFIPLPFPQAHLNTLQILILVSYFLLFIGISELLFRWLTK